MKQTLLQTVVLLLAGLTFLADAQAADISEAIDHCAAITNDTDRLRCFDAIAAAQAVSSSAPVGDQNAAAGADNADKPQPVRDDFGLERVKDAEKPAAAEYSAVVVRCEQSKSSGRYFFYLENGQVWKQSNVRRLSWRECRFDATLTKDGFGYKLYVPSKDRRIRVTRVR